ncbi:MAG: preprotein translocase subunit YajC [Limisphaerales bacterium]
MIDAVFIPLLALGAPAGQGQSSAPAWMQLVPFILLIGVFFLIVILPQQRREKAHRELLKTLKSGDKVVTSSGLCGTIVSVGETRVTLRSEDAKVEVLKSAVSEITERKA